MLAKVLVIVVMLIVLVTLISFVIFFMLEIVQSHKWKPKTNYNILENFLNVNGFISRKMFIKK